MQIRKPTQVRAAIVVALLALLVAPAALAGKPSGGGGGGGGAGGCKHCAPSYTGSFVGTNPVMVSDANGNGAPNYGDQITFNVTSNATYYFVEMDCSQNGTMVERETNGFYPGWPWSKNYVLTSTGWSSGGASCTATLYSSLSDGSNRQNLATVSFQVGA